MWVLEYRVQPGIEDHNVAPNARQYARVAPTADCVESPLNDS